MDVPLWVWPTFVGFVLAMLAVDLFLFHSDAHEVKIKEAGAWVAVWVTLALMFGGLIWAWQGRGFALEYLSGYLLEWALSVDNMFVFALLFTYFALPRAYQHRVLFWGILGALVFRAAFIAVGAALLELFHWTIFVFGAFLVVTGARMAFSGGEEVHPERNPVLRLVRRLLPMTPDYREQRFFVREAGRRMATPMLAVLVAVETTDIIFAVDSIPAIFGVTKETFIVFSSNAFAIMGLRALFFVLSGMMHRFDYLKYGLSAVLVFIGVKMLISDVLHIGTAISLSVIAGTIAASVLVSLFVERGAPSPVEDQSKLNPAPSDHE